MTDNIMSDNEQGLLQGVLHKAAKECQKKGLVTLHEVERLYCASC